MCNTVKLTVIILSFAVTSGCVQVDKPSAPIQTTFDSLKKSGLSDSSGLDQYILHPDGDSTGAAFEDTTINNIGFDDCSTITRLFGDSIRLLPDCDDLPRIQIKNRNGTELLTMYMWNGSTSCSFQQYQIEAMNEKTLFYSGQYFLDAKSFISGRGVKLGLGETDLVKLLGTPTSVETSGQERVYKYEVLNDLYFGEYHFINGILFKFRFGNEYP